jgi:cation transport ATPase
VNYYEILGVTCYATNSEIGMAFRALAKRYHPDLNKNPDAKNKFIQIYEAYSILKDEKKKKVYDEFILNKNTNVKKETEQAKTYTKWEEDAKQEAKYYSEAKYSVFKKNIIGGVFVVGIRILFLFIVAVVWAFLDLNNNALSFILGIIVAAIVCFFLASIFDRFNEK